MFSYFGSKAKIISKYPPPDYPYIIEPFCGSAQYSCMWGLDLPSWRRLGLVRDVWINDKYQTIHRIWKYLQQASLKDIEKLPELKLREDLRDIKWLSQPERDLLGFAINEGSNSPRNIAQLWGTANAGRTHGTKRLKQSLRRIIGNISHWKITCLDFAKVKITENATYFIDPPYQTCEYDYKIKRTPDLYKRLRTYIKHRNGQRIVCEGNGADWLDFKPLCTTGGQRGKQSELIRVFE